MTRVANRVAGAFAAIATGLFLAACQTGGAGQYAAQGVSSSGLSHLAEIRSNASLSALAPDRTLERAAIRQASYMASSDKMDHTTGWRRDFATRMSQDGVAAPAAENLAHGRMDTARVFQMWMASTGHRNNMLDPRFEKYGLAHATAADGRRYWAWVLGR